jgi:ABC-type lipoprotein release transport system permease subunit
MNRYSVRILTSQPIRLFLTIAGVALCIVLMLFLLSVYCGVADGSVEYIRHNKADLWVLQRNAWNILRCSSILSTAHGYVIRGVPNVQSISPVLLLLSTVRKGEKVATVYLAGFDPQTVMGGPPHLVEGRSVLYDNEIVLDRSFAKKFHFKLGDSVQLQEDMLQVVGISSGTNAFVIQYAFVTLKRAQSLLGFPNIVTCYLIKVEHRKDISKVSEEVREELPGLEVYDHETFLRNNIHEMQSGFLPFIYTIAAIGVVVLTAILSLLLSVNILEKRKDFAVMKTLGSSKGFLSRLIIGQALIISFAGSIVAVIFFFPMVALIEKFSPEISTKSSIEQITSVVFVVVIMGLVSSLISLQRLRRIYALEAFL